MVAAVVVEVLLVRGGAIVGQGLRVAAVSTGYLRIYNKEKFGIINRLCSGLVELGNFVQGSPG